MNHNKFQVGDKLTHKNLGDAEYTDACYHMDKLHNCDVTSVHIYHNGDVKEVTLSQVVVMTK